MPTRRIYWIYLSVWLAAMLAAWFVAVPDWVSAWTLGWGGVVAVVLSAATIELVRKGGPTRSIAHVLYDTEHASDAGPAGDAAATRAGRR